MGNTTYNQPNQPRYPIHPTMDLFVSYASRLAYQQATGKQPPPFDASQPVKNWEDPSAAGSYTCFDLASGTLKPFTAGGPPNLPGVYTYPPYASAPTDAVMVGPNGPVANANPDQFCLQADAQALANALAPLFGGKAPQLVLETQSLFHYVYYTVQSRPWMLVFPATQVFAQQLILAMNSHGVGYPGHWVLSTDNLPNWVADAPNTNANPTLGVVPMPVRPLYPNEQFLFVAADSPFANNGGQGGWVVERTDLPQPTAAPAAQPTNADIMAKLVDLETRLVSKFGI